MPCYTILSYTSILYYTTLYYAMLCSATLCLVFAYNTIELFTCVLWKQKQTNSDIVPVASDLCKLENRVV